MSWILLNLAFALAGLAHIGLARSAQIPVEQSKSDHVTLKAPLEVSAVPQSTHASRQAATQNAFQRLQALHLLLLAFDPAAAFIPEVAGAGLPVGSRCSQRLASSKVRRLGKVVAQRSSKLQELADEWNEDDWFQRRKTEEKFKEEAAAVQEVEPLTPLEIEAIEWQENMTAWLDTDFVGQERKYWATFMLGAVETQGKNRTKILAQQRDMKEMKMRAEREEKMMDRKKYCVQHNINMTLEYENGNIIKSAIAKARSDVLAEKEIKDTLEKALPFLQPNSTIGSVALVLLAQSYEKAGNAVNTENTYKKMLSHPEMGVRMEVAKLLDTIDERLKKPDVDFWDEWRKKQAEWQKKPSGPSSKPLLGWLMGKKGKDKRR